MTHQERDHKLIPVEALEMMHGMHLLTSLKPTITCWLKSTPCSIIPTSSSVTSIESKFVVTTVGSCATKSGS